MKKFKLLFTAVGILAVVGSALAFRAASNPNLLLCDDGICVEQTTTIFSTVRPNPQAQPINPGQPVYLGTEGEECSNIPTDPCHRFTGNVFNNN